MPIYRIDSNSATDLRFGRSVRTSDVKAGDPVIRFDKAFIEGKGINLTTMVVFTGGFDKEIQTDVYNQKVNAGDVVISE